MAFKSTLYSYRNNDYEEVTTPYSGPIYSAGPQPLVHPIGKQIVDIGKVGLGIGGLYAFGQMQFGPNYRGWDAIAQSVRFIEEYSPYQIFRTFQLSTMLSPLEAASQRYRYFSPDIIRQLRLTNEGYTWLSDLNKLGIDIYSSQVAEKGFRFEGGQLLLGKTDTDVLLKHAGVIRSTTGATPLWQEAGARSLAGGPVKNARSAFTSLIPFETAGGVLDQEVFKFIGGKSKLSVGSRYLTATGTSYVERFNRLIKDPFAFLGESRIAGKIGSMLGVESSSGLKTLGKLGFKLGIAIPATILGLQELDYWTGNIVSHSAVRMWQGLQIGISQLAEITGLHALREKQEEVAPGSTTLKKLMAFPIIGGLTMGGLSYGKRIVTQGTYQLSGMSLETASKAVKYKEALIQEVLYNREVSPALKAGLTNETLELIEKSANKSLSSFQGRLTKKIVGMQGQKGIVGLTKYLGEMSLTKTNVFLGMAAGLAVVSPFLLGALVPSKRPDELRKIYSGEELVPMRKGRMWLMGRSSFEGKKISAYVPHWSVRYLTHARDIGIYGERKSPLQKFFISNFSYDLEKKHYYDRPYPISSTAFQGVPLIGPVLSATIGKVVKPPRLMHQEILGRTQSGELAYQEPALRNGEYYPSTELGGLGMGTPISPFGLKGIIGQQTYALSEMTGLPGFMWSTIKEKITGTGDIFSQEMRLQSAYDMASFQRDYWEEELGDIGGLSEAFRRLFPSKNNQIPEWNEIPNTLANVSWIPGPGDNSPNFKTGDPMLKIPLGEFRIPGPAYFTLHPELKDIPLEQWSPLDKLRVLGDIAPYSDKYKEILSQVRSTRKTPEEEEEYKKIVKQVAEKKISKEFFNYKYKQPARTEAQKLLATANESDKESTPGFLGSMFGKYWETIAHNIETPMEYLTPMSPASKLVHMRTAVEDYERTQVFGQEAGFWQHPIRDFLRPFFSSLQSKTPYRHIPEHILRKRGIQEYFDILEYVKYTRLRNQALREHDQDIAQEYEEKRKQTLIGANVLSRNFSRLFKALPRNEKDYFSEFVKADLDERQELMQLLPENEKRLYQGQWLLKDIDDMKKAKEKGLLNSKQEAKLLQMENMLIEMQKNEGYEQTPSLLSDYHSEKEDGESYGDWYRRTKIIQARLENMPLPGPDWVGYSPTVDLDLVKSKLLDNLGESSFDYDIWQDTKRMVARSPYIEEAVEELQKHEDPDTIKKRLRMLLASQGVRNASIHLIENKTGRNKINMRISEDRSDDIMWLKNKGKI